MILLVPTSTLYIVVFSLFISYYIIHVRCWKITSSQVKALSLLPSTARGSDGRGGGGGLWRMKDQCLSLKCFF